MKWYRDTMLLDANENWLMEQYGFRHSMVIREAARADFGNYSCSAENSLGRSRAFIEVSGEQMLLGKSFTYSGPQVCVCFQFGKRELSVRFSAVWNCHSYC